MKKKVNVLMVGSDLSVKGGMTTVVESFLYNKFSKEIHIKFVPTHIENNIFRQVIFFLKALIKIIYLLIFNNISIVHMHLSEKGSFYRKYVIFLIGKLFDKKIIIHMHGAEFKEFYESSSKKIKRKIIKLLKESDCVLVLGDNWNDYVKGLNKEINTKIFRNSVKSRNESVIREENNVNILFLAVLIERKGIFDLIEAAKIIVNNKDLCKYNIKFTIAGTGSEEKSCKQKVIEYGLNNIFDFKGWVKGKEKYDLLKESQIFVLPSYNEGLPVAILEAMSYGLPIISTNVGSIEDAVHDGINGFIISPGDVNLLAQRISECILEEDLWNIFSKNSRRFIDETYNDKLYFDNIENLYLKLSQ